MPNAVLTEAAAFAESLADTARAILGPAWRDAPVTQWKEDASPVTALDRAVEQRLRAMIEQRFPGHGFIGEETGQRGRDAEFAWIIDPIDGTAQFIAGIPVFGTLIALLREGVPVVGVMDFAGSGDRWSGAAGGATTWNGKPVSTRPCGALADAALAVNGPDFFNGPRHAAMTALKDAARLRVTGAAALAYGMLASGRIDLAISGRLDAHDCMAFRPIIEGAGGVVTDWSGKPLTLATSGAILAAGSPGLHGQALAIIASSSI